MNFHPAALSLACFLFASCDSPPKPLVAQAETAPATPGSPAPVNPAPSPVNPSPVNPSPQPALVGNFWLAEDIENKGVIDNARSFIRFDAPDKVSGNGGINKFSGSCTLEDANLTFGPMRSTKMAGPPAVMNQETAFHQALAKVKSFKFDENGTLFLNDGDGKAVLRLAAYDGP